MAKSLNKAVTKVFFQLIDGLDEYGERTIANSDVFMAVHVKDRGEVGPKGWKVYSIAHFGTQNGDAMADPEMDFLVIEDLVFPMSYRNDYMGIHRLSLDVTEDGKFMIREAMQADAASFATVWLRNIREQQGINAKACRA